MVLPVPEGPQIKIGEVLYLAARQMANSRSRKTQLMPTPGKRVSLSSCGISWTHRRSSSLSSAVSPAIRSSRYCCFTSGCPASRDLTSLRLLLAIAALLKFTGNCRFAVDPLLLTLIVFDEGFFIQVLHPLCSFRPAVCRRYLASGVSDGQEEQRHQ